MRAGKKRKLAERLSLSSLVRGVGEDVCGPQGRRGDHHDLQGLDGLSATATSRKVYKSVKIDFQLKKLKI